MNDKIKEETIEDTSNIEEERIIQSEVSDQEADDLRAELGRERDALIEAYTLTAGGSPSMFVARLRNLKELGIYKGDCTASGYCTRMREINETIKGGC
jgi:hypothetical protein